MIERGRSEIYIQEKKNLNVSALASVDVRRKCQNSNLTPKFCVGLGLRQIPFLIFCWCCLCRTLIRRKMWNSTFSSSTFSVGNYLPQISRFKFCVHNFCGSWSTAKTIMLVPIKWLLCGTACPPQKPC